MSCKKSKGKANICDVRKAQSVICRNEKHNLLKKYPYRYVHMRLLLVCVWKASLHLGLFGYAEH